MGEYAQSVRVWLRGLDVLPGDHSAWQSIRGRLGGDGREDPDEQQLAAAVGAAVLVLRSGADAQRDAASRSLTAAQQAIGVAVHPRTRSAAESLAKADQLLVSGTEQSMSQALGAIEAAEDDLESREGDIGGSTVSAALAATSRARAAVQQAIILRHAVDAAPLPPKPAPPTPPAPQPGPPTPPTPETKPSVPKPYIQGKPPDWSDDIPLWGWVLIGLGAAYVVKKL